MSQDVENGVYFRPPPVLYKYLTTDLINVLENRSLKCTYHQDFSDLFDSYHVDTPNDPNELNPVGSQTYFQEVSASDVSSEAARMRARIIIREWAKKSVAAYPGFSVENIVFLDPFPNMNSRRAYIEGYRSVYFKALENPLLLCLTENPKDRTMWERYSGNHTGFCLGFKSSAKFFYAGVATGGRKVIYSEEPSSGPPEVGIWRRWVVKHPAFSHEREWRFRYPFEKTITVELPGSKNIRAVQFDEQDLECVILGAKTSQKLKEQILHLIPRSVGMFKIRPEYKEYSLEQIR